MSFNPEYYIRAFDTGMFLEYWAAHPNQGWPSAILRLSFADLLEQRSYSCSQNCAQIWDGLAQLVLQLAGDSKLRDVFATFSFWISQEGSNPNSAKKA